MNQTQRCALTLGLLLLLPSLSQAAAGRRGVTGSPHDFSLEYWSVSQGVCSPCHQAHNTAPSQIVPLWAHVTSGATFTPYDSPTFNAGRHQPGGSSLACLSCHDGTVAINQFIGGLEGEIPEYVPRGNQVGTDLHAIHPVSFTYDAALATADGNLEDPTTYHIGDPKSVLTVNTAPVPTSWAGNSLDGKTIDQAMLFNHKMECSSCHDVHKLEGSAPVSLALERISGSDATGRRDLLCRTCHIK